MTESMLTTEAEIAQRFGMSAERVRQIIDMYKLRLQQEGKAIVPINATQGMIDIYCGPDEGVSTERKSQMAMDYHNLIVACDMENSL